MATKPRRKLTAEQRAILLQRLAKARAVKAARKTVKNAGRRAAAMRKRVSRKRIRARATSSLRQQKHSKFNFF